MHKKKKKSQKQKLIVNDLKGLFKCTTLAIQMIALQGIQLQLHLLALQSSTQGSLVGTEHRESKTRFTILHCNHTHQLKSDFERNHLHALSLS